MVTEIEPFEYPDICYFFFMWGLIKSEVYKRKVGAADELLAGTLVTAGRINKREARLRRKTRDLRTRVAKCTEVDVGIFRKFILKP